VPQSQLPANMILNPDNGRSYRITVTGNPPIIGIEEVPVPIQASPPPQAPSPDIGTPPTFP
jgi:hypothetical protein